MEQDYAVILGAAQGLLVCSLTVICGSIMEWLLQARCRRKAMESREACLGPARARVREYETAFRKPGAELSGPFGPKSPRKAESREKTEKTGKSLCIRRMGRPCWTLRRKLNLLWNTRLEENREAMAVQLNEMAQIMTDTVEHAWDTHSDEETGGASEEKAESHGAVGSCGAGLLRGTPAPGGLSDHEHHEGGDAWR